MPEGKGKATTIDEKRRRAKVSLDRSIEEHGRRRQVAVRVDVEGARGTQPLRGALTFDQLKAGGYIKQRQKDQFTVRCRCPGGRVPVEWLRAIATAAEKHGKGFVHLSFRQSIEIPYVSHADFPSLTSVLADGGVRVASCGPRVRVPTACGGCEYNPNGLTDTQAMAQLVDREFFGEQLYHKFKISFSGCPIDCARSSEMDLAFQGAVHPIWSENDCTGCTICSNACLEGAIVPDPRFGSPQFEPSKCLYCADCVRACPTESWRAGATGWVVRVGGRHGRHPRNGAVVARLLPDDLVVPFVRAVVDWYRVHGQGRGRTRIGELLRDPGAMQSLLGDLDPVAGRYLVRDSRPPEPVDIHRFPAEEPGWVPGIGAAPRHGQARTRALAKQSGAQASMTETSCPPAATLDLAGVVCPLTWMRTRGKLASMTKGELLEVVVDEGRPADELPRSAKAEGHKVRSVALAGGRVLFVVECRGLEGGTE